METAIQILNSFISAAEKSRKYPSKTAYNLRASLKLIESTLNEEEAASIEKFEQNIENIFQAYYQKNKLRVSASSLETYKSRVRKVIRDYNTHGTTPSKMAAWNPTFIVRKQKSSIESDSQKPEDSSAPQVYEGLKAAGSGGLQSAGNVTRFEMKLREGDTFVILTPHKLLKEDLVKIRAYIDFLDKMTD